MNQFTSGDLYGLLITAAVLAFLAFILIRPMRTTAADLTALRKRCLMWTQLTTGLFAMQLLMRGDLRFSLVLLLIALFTASLWLAARTYEQRQDRTTDREDPPADQTSVS